MKKIFARSTLALALSIAAMPILVNGQGQSLSSVNSAKSSNEPALKDAIKDTKADVKRLIETMLKNGSDGTISSVLAPVIGLPKAMPMRREEIVISAKGSDFERRGCWVIYESEEGPGSKDGVKRTVCTYVLKATRAGTDNQVQYFRIDPDGTLVKAILSKSKADAAGKPVRGSGVKTDLDIDSPEVKKAFDAEMDFWLKDWLKKQQKVPAKKA